MLAGFLLLLLLTDGESSERNCSHQDVLKHLNLTENKELSMTRPAKNYQEPTTVYLYVLLYAILDVHLSESLEVRGQSFQATDNSRSSELFNGELEGNSLQLHSNCLTQTYIIDMRVKDQQLLPYIWMNMWWKNDYISWKPEEFCGIEYIFLPTELFWKPDITIKEMIEKNKAPPSPYLIVYHTGEIELTNDGMLVSTCKMHVYKFPFDIQKCDLTFKSMFHSEKDILLVQYQNSTKVTEDTHQLMQTQYEWLFVNMTVSRKTADNLGYKNKTMIVYTVSIKRRSALYIINFMVPILLFLCLDLSSFLISDNAGEKLSFKVTVLLAVTVMQLILNEILPSSSDKVPLIAVFCVGIFGLMLLSLLETILVLYLLRSDNKKKTSRDNMAEENQSLREDSEDKQNKICSNNCIRGNSRLFHCVCDLSPTKTTSELLPVAKEDNSSQLMEECPDLEKLSDELKEVLKTLSELLSSREEDVTSGYWYRKTKIINRVFFIFYIVSVTLFLTCMFFSWTADD